MGALLNHRPYYKNPEAHSLRALVIRAGTPAQAAVFSQLLVPRFDRQLFDTRAGAAVSVLFPLRVQIGLAHLFWQFEVRLAEAFRVSPSFAMTPKDILLLNSRVTNDIPATDFLLDFPSVDDVKKTSELLKNPFIVLGDILPDSVDAMFEHWQYSPDPTLRKIISSNDIVMAADVLCQAWNFNTPTTTAIIGVCQKWSLSNWRPDLADSN